MAKAMLIDTDLCLDCNACSVECKNINQVPVGKDIAWTRIDELESGQFPNVNAYFVKQACNHCTEANCLNNCPVGAISRPDGTHVVIDQGECIGCGTCARVCPFGIPHFGEPAGKAQKCRFCYGTKASDEPTTCASVCPFGAISFGERAELIRNGQERVVQLVANGKTAANLYGQNELGGLNVLYVLTDKPSVFDLPEAPVSTGPSATAVPTAVPTASPTGTPMVSEEDGGIGAGAWTAIGVGGAAALYWIIRRRMQSQEATIEDET